MNSIVRKFHDLNKIDFRSTMNIFIFIEEKLNMCNWYDLICMTMDNEYFGVNRRYERNVSKVVLFEVCLWS